MRNSVRQGELADQQTQCHKSIEAAEVRRAHPWGTVKVIGNDYLPLIEDHRNQSASLQETGLAFAR